MKYILKAAKYSAIIILAFGCYIGVLIGLGNFHTVIPGEFYRSAQLSPEMLADVAKEHKIKTIINLRGPNMGKKWYDDEVKVAKDLGIEHVDFRMSMKRPFTQQQVVDLMAIYKAAQKPILIHCRSGSDRTGLAAALYVAAIAHGGEEDAEGQISLLYGHIPFTASHYMDSSWEVMEPFLGFTDS